MKLILNEKSSIDATFHRWDKFQLKLKFTEIEVDQVKRAIENFHKMLVDGDSHQLSSRFEKTITGVNGGKLTIVAISSSQQNIISRLFSC